jgi:hypothetical protein
MYDDVLPKKLRDKILRELKAKPAKSLKHGDHDQSEHGSWATGGEDKEPKVFPYDPAGEVDDDVDKSDMGTAMEYIPSGPTELVDRWAWNG